ncbi:MAG: xanthine dehydrogenase accessory protein XdhC [Rhodobacteraceae bacterium]|nr:xanthine dehydrogenase accessory protein XdhC [Paracoccaceae bacterium]
MALNPTALRDAVTRHGPVIRVVIAAHRGSSPREAGAAMLVWGTAEPGGQSGTIGGGALEFAAAARARSMLAAGTEAQVDRTALGPALGQCCGGAVTLVYERFDAAALATIPETGLYARRIEGAAAMPLAIARARREARGQGMTTTHWASGWLAEPVSPPARPLWIWGAGHVGRAITATLAPLPDVAITWVDTAPDRFPDTIPPGVTALPAPMPADLVTRAPQDAEHLILTYSHALDLELCHRLLAHGFARAGLIGSASKWARFRNRLRALGHADPRIARITCPIGDPRFGKHPQAIAIGVAARLLGEDRTRDQAPACPARR